MTTDADVADQIVDTIRTWIDREVIPNASEFELADEYPAEMVEQMKAFGLFGATIPTEYGGLGLDTLTYARVMEELSRGWMSLSGVLNSHLITAMMITRSGTDDQRRRLLPDMASGARRGCFSLSEPDVGSDAKSLQCKATLDGDTYVINGTKMWVTNGIHASIVGLLARTPDDGITCFLVEKEPGGDFEGIRIGRKIKKLGYRGLETVEMSYADHSVPATCVLGGSEGLGRGLPAALGALELGRINIAARAVGVGQAAFDAAFDYSQTRETFGHPIARHQAIQFKLADMATKLEASRLLTHNAARMFDNGERADVEAGMAKLFASEAAFEIATEAMRVHGGNGFTSEYPVERFYRDAPLMMIGEGTNEIQRLVIARGLMRRRGIEL